MSSQNPLRDAFGSPLIRNYNKSGAVGRVEVEISRSPTYDMLNKSSQNPKMKLQNAMRQSGVTQTKTSQEPTNQSLNVFSALLPNDPASPVQSRIFSQASNT